MPWLTYKAVMEGALSPMQATDAMRRANPGGALDQAPGYSTRPMVPDRRARDNGNGQLSPEFHRATMQYLNDAGCDPDDINGVGKILAKYSGMADDGLELPGRGGPRGTFNDQLNQNALNQTEPSGAQDRMRNRRLAHDQMDQYGQPRSNGVRPMAVRNQDFERRFPQTRGIRVL